MQDKPSIDTIAIVAASLTSALLASNVRRIEANDDVGDVLSIYWQFCGELEETYARDKS